MLSATEKLLTKKSGEEIKMSVSATVQFGKRAKSELKATVGLFGVSRIRWITQNVLRFHYTPFWKCNTAH